MVAGLGLPFWRTDHVISQCNTNYTSLLKSLPRLWTITFRSSTGKQTQGTCAGFLPSPSLTAAGVAAPRWGCFIYSAQVHRAVVAGQTELAPWTRQVLPDEIRATVKPARKFWLRFKSHCYLLSKEMLFTGLSGLCSVHSLAGRRKIQRVLVIRSEPLSSERKTYKVKTE